MYQKNTCATDPGEQTNWAKLLSNSLNSTEPVTQGSSHKENIQTQPEREVYQKYTGDTAVYTTIPLNCPKWDQQPRTDSMVGGSATPGSRTRKKALSTTRPSKRGMCIGAFGKSGYPGPGGCGHGGSHPHTTAMDREVAGSWPAIANEGNSRWSGRCV